MTITYRNYHITYAPPPVPVRCADWQWHHDDYDGAPDSNDNRYGFSASLEEAKSDIDEMIAELEDGTPSRLEHLAGMTPVAEAAE